MRPREHLQNQRRINIYSSTSKMALCWGNCGKLSQYWGGVDCQSHGGSSMLNIGEYPKEENVSTLSQILQDGVPDKYCLSPKACLGILRRASERGKELPSVLKKALLRKASELERNRRSFPTGKPSGRQQSENVLRRKVQALTSRMGTGGGNVPLLLKIRCGCEGGGKGPLIQRNRSATLSCNNDQTLFQPKVYGICAKNSNSMLSDNPNDFAVEEELEPTMVAKGPGAVAQPTYCANHRSFMIDASEEVAGTLQATDYKDPPIVNDVDGTEYIVRRLTPTECARLQGFPDFWCSELGTENPSEKQIDEWKEIFETHRKIMGKPKGKTEKQIREFIKKPHSDSAEYKMWGNGVALPCVYFVLSGIAWAAER